MKDKSRYTKQNEKLYIKEKGHKNIIKTTLKDGRVITKMNQVPIQILSEKENYMIELQDRKKEKRCQIGRSIYFRMRLSYTIGFQFFTMFEPHIVENFFLDIYIKNVKNRITERKQRHFENELKRIAESVTNERRRKM